MYVSFIIHLDFSFLHTHVRLCLIPFLFFFRLVFFGHLDYNSDYTVASRGPPSMRQPPGAYHNSASSTSRSAGATSLTVAPPTWLVCCMLTLLLLVQWSTGGDTNPGRTVDEDPRASSIFMAVLMIAGRTFTLRKQPNFRCSLNGTSTSLHQPSSLKTNCSTISENTNNNHIVNGIPSR